MAVHDGRPAHEHPRSHRQHGLRRRYVPDRGCREVRARCWLLRTRLYVRRHRLRSARDLRAEPRRRERAVELRHRRDCKRHLRQHDDGGRRPPLRSGDGTGAPPYGYIGGVYVLESSESEPGPTHTLVDDTPYKEEEPVRAVITSDPENAEELDFDSGATVTLSGGDSSSPTGEIVSYEWDIDADGEFEKSGESIEVELDYCGILEMTLRVTDDSDRTQTTSISLSTV
ncbi:PKD domain-containing protein [Haladaptatus sp. GCM10025707]|uniref:PKD domain-containing protein n=1 Tax=Haladaptatus sp. GCM10025707 TaxID=3252658 RepID=UPI00361AADEA